MKNADVGSAVLLSLKRHGCVGGRLRRQRQRAPQNRPGGAIRALADVVGAKAEAEAKAEAKAEAEAEAEARAEGQEEDRQ